MRSRRTSRCAGSTPWWRRSCCAVGGHVRRHERIHLPAVPARVLGPPRVVDVVGGVTVVLGRVLQEMEGQQPSVGVRADDGRVAELLPDRAGGAVDLVVHDVGVGEAPDTRQRAEVVVERAVLLHEDDDVPDIAQRGIGADGVDRQGPFDARPGGRGQSETGGAGTAPTARPPLKRVRRLTRWVLGIGPPAPRLRSSIVVAHVRSRSPVPARSIGLALSFPAFQMRNPGGSDVTKSLASVQQTFNEQLGARRLQLGLEPCLEGQWRRFPPARTGRGGEG